MVAPRDIIFQGYAIDLLIFERNHLFMFTHIESQSAYRNPVGAVTEGTALELSIVLSDEKDVQKVYLVVLYNDSTMKSYQMEKKSNVHYREDNIQYDYKSVYEQDNEAESNEIYKVKIDTVKGLYFYHFEVEYSDKKDYLYKDGKQNYPDNNMSKWQITVYDKNFQTPDFYKGGIIYHIFVDRFNSVGEVKIRDGFYMHKDKSDVPFYKPDANGKIKNEDVYGGNLRGIIEKLDYLKELSVSIIYLSPVFEAHSNHKYNTADYTKIDDMFGDDEIFDELIAKADKLGMKIILDGVFNHTGDDSIYFNKYGRYDSIGAYQSMQSQYYDWYTFREWRDDYECWWGVPLLPAIKKDQPVFRAFICGVDGIVEKWLKRGIAGFRIDVADELSDRMLKGINRASKDVSSEKIVIGEVWEDASNKMAYGYRRQYLLGNQLDSVMNYPLKDAVINYLRTGNSKIIADVMQMIMMNYPKPSIDCLMNLLDSHDTVRILTALGTAVFSDNRDEMAAAKLMPAERSRGVTLLKMAVALQMTLPGVPCIYYGDEAGMEGYGDPFCRKYFPWDNIDGEIHLFYKKMGAIRKNHKLFVDGGYELIDGDDGIFCFRRFKGEQDSADYEEIIVCVNLSDKIYYLTDKFEDKILKSLITNRRGNSVKAGEWDIFDENIYYPDYNI